MLEYIQWENVIILTFPLKAERNCCQNWPYFNFESSEKNVFNQIIANESKV